MNRGGKGRKSYEAPPIALVYCCSLLLLRPGSQLLILLRGPIGGNPKHPNPCRHTSAPCVSLRSVGLEVQPWSPIQVYFRSAQELCARLVFCWRRRSAAAMACLALSLQPVNGPDVLLQTYVLFLLSHCAFFLFAQVSALITMIMELIRVPVRNCGLLNFLSCIANFPAFRCWLSPWFPHPCRAILSWIQ